jgi:hypothetical protein
MELGVSEASANAPATKKKRATKHWRPKLTLREPRPCFKGAAHNPNNRIAIGALIRSTRQPDNFRTLLKNSQRFAFAYCGTCWLQSVMATEIAAIGGRLDGAKGATPGSSA